MQSCSTRLMLAATLGITALCLPAAAQDTQGDASQSQDVAEAARRARAQKKTEAPAQQVWTDENIRKIPQPEAAAEKAPGEEAQAGEAAASGEAAKQAKPDTAADDAKKAAQQEAQWRQKFADANKKLEDDQKDLSLMERELGLKRQQYFSDPNTALRDQYQRDSGTGGEVNDLVKKIDEQKQKIEADRQAITDLEEGLRKAGLPPGWSRP